MKNLNEKLVTSLFETKALKVCPQDKPFWYTSGTIGPYYVNTQFLYGSEEKSKELLDVIDVEKENKLTCSKVILNKTLINYREDTIYNGLIDEMVSFIKTNINLDEINYISGGERRDWFFSLIIADILNKPHITVFKDLSAVLFSEGKTEVVTNINGKNVLHIADIITEASSYTRAWIPAIKKLGGNLKWSLVVVDRLQGGTENLAANGVMSYALVDMDKSLFDKALSLKLLNEAQYNMIMHYIENPKEAMRTFLLEHPEFMENALKADEKTRERAQMCLDKNIYEL